MSNAVEYHFCPHCQRGRHTLNPVPEVEDFFKFATLGVLPVLMSLLRHFALPVRCSTCFGALRSSFRGTAEAVFPQTPGDIDARLSIFDTGLRQHATRELADPDSIDRFFNSDRGDTRQLKENGFEVGGRREKILHVARIHPEFLLQGYVAKFVYRLFLPITWFNFRHRRAKHPLAQFFPLDLHRAGRAVLTDKRLVIFTQMSSWLYRHTSIPYSAIRQVRQHQSSIRIQLKSGESRTVTVRIGPELGELLRAMHKLGGLPVLDPDRNW